jgi:hypothetical protein
MFVLKEFIMKILKEKIGNEPDYRVRELALGWFTKGELNQKDLADIDDIIENRNKILNQGGESMVNTAENTTESAEIDTEIEEQEETPLILE